MAFVFECILGCCIPSTAESIFCCFLCERCCPIDDEKKQKEIDEHGIDSLNITIGLPCDGGHCLASSDCGNPSMNLPVKGNIARILPVDNCFYSNDINQTSNGTQRSIVPWNGTSFPNVDDNDCSAAKRISPSTLSQSFSPVNHCNSISSSSPPSSSSSSIPLSLPSSLQPVKSIRSQRAYTAITFSDFQLNKTLPAR